ncbi:hypothetical protein [Streptomyces flaveolus]|uniref:hypothetical protein n=1 Tax=Streptomyces flaveolus TaxID=67297 RepID=UPI00381F8A8B
MPTVTAGAAKAAATATRTRTPHGMCAVVRLPTWASSVSPRIGLMDGYARFTGVVHSSPASSTAGQISRLHGTVTAPIGRRPTAAGDPTTCPAASSCPWTGLSDRVLNYAVRGAD